MSSSNKTVYLISGTNRGIGYGLAALIAARPNTIVFAGARDPTAQSLKDLAAKHPNVHPVKLTSGDQADNEAAIAEIQKTAGRLDVLIANAGIAKHIGTLATTPLSEFRDHWEVNTLGIVVLFQAAHTLLLASPTGAPIFAYVSSGGASMARYFHSQMAAYGSSKAAANFFVKVLDAEHPSLIALAIHPGWVATEMGNLGAVANGLPAAPVTVEDSVKGVMSRIDGATKEKSSGRFWNFYADKSGRPWDIETEEVPW
ncbi:NAD(P)-binding protein [Mycena venus]|uniref:NAD(P)-binding protein n=1 Tax=Mycena venus TaxID=2733690 RepID=A0A8H7DBJ9_9AGAR|nr:NAD(P)-binding protein [Mycena venus]